jgi:hypothetical protein
MCKAISTHASKSALTPLLVIPFAMACVADQFSFVQRIWNPFFLIRELCASTVESLLDEHAVSVRAVVVSMHWKLTCTATVHTLSTTLQITRGEVQWC